MSLLLLISVIISFANVQGFDLILSRLGRLAKLINLLKMAKR